MSLFDDKIITVEEALNLVKDGDQIVTGLGCSESQTFFNNLHTIADRIEEPVTINNCLPMVEYEYFKPEYKDKFFLAGWFYTPVIRRMHKNGNASFIPNNLHLAGIRRFEHIKPNIYVGSASWVDEHGYISLSMGNTYEREAMDKADIVILEPNKKFPRTFGDVSVHVSEVDYLIPSDYDPPIIPDAESSEIEMKIGRYIADLIKDGDTLQLGIGGIPNAVARELYDKKDLGVHTEMLTSEMAKLAKAGVITGAKKTQNRGKMVTTFIMGDQELYDFVNNNPSVMVMAGSYTNNPYVIGRERSQVSINTIIEIDLTGQAASESIGPMQISGTGGQADTVRGAQYSKYGRSILALSSTALVRNRETGEREQKSKIVPILTPGAIVSTQRQDVDLVVTEYGVAELRGTTVLERVKRLIKIAHPDYREELLEQAKEYGIIG